ncbi:ribosome-recycling factor, mitochondrial [Denticeps clupeoides]|uniref:Ribosome-recycling factor, mitochondrial n=1 Tax=Denticeps clupeoides TaxID=299321 RepID=A0AAY4E3R8_9TELE|nr:ribosome-recycling factor, mitochondrial [Denticeps clupeoides]XP_028828968.1 ribosome-recycling factor, mitochondrial [Denticeps clupeoides]XP_028828969.1 ribosome-recycling factor, mitochondrial [Denticeps clupeoides]
MALNQLSLLRPALGHKLMAVVKPQLGGNARVPFILLTNGCLRTTTAHPPSLACFYATKKSKAKAKAQPAKVNINSSLVEDIISLEEVKEEMESILEALKDDFSRNLGIRTSPGALDHITVTTKDGKVPLNQIGQVSMKSPQLIMVNMTGFPEATAAAARALRESSMKLNPEVEGTIIRVPVPKVTREHRENLAKLAKQFGNKAKESLRRVRSNAVSRVKKSKDTVSEDTLRLVEKQVQQMADSYTVDIDKQLVTKTKELLG